MSVKWDKSVIEGDLGHYSNKTSPGEVVRFFLLNMYGSLNLIFKGKSVPLAGCRTVRRGSLPSWFPYWRWDHPNGTSLLGCSILGPWSLPSPEEVREYTMSDCTCKEKGNNVYEIVASHYCHVSVCYLMICKQYEMYQFTPMKTVEFKNTGITQHVPN